MLLEQFMVRSIEVVFERMLTQDDRKYKIKLNWAEGWRWAL